MSNIKAVAQLEPWLESMLLASGQIDASVDLRGVIEDVDTEARSFTVRFLPGVRVGYAGLSALAQMLVLPGAEFRLRLGTYGHAQRADVSFVSRPLLEITAGAPVVDPMAGPSNERQPEVAGLVVPVEPSPTSQ